jgi:hypothetical protein
MLQPLRLFVNLVPGVIEKVVQEPFQQPMVANDFQSALSSGWRKAHAVVLLVADERGMISRQLLQHPGHGSRANAEPLRQRIAGNTILLRAAQFEDGFEVVVDRFALCVIFSHA